MSTKLNQIVFVIDDDESMRSAISRLLRAVDLEVQMFPSGQKFLASKLPDVPGCIVLDVRLPGLSGLALQQEMFERDIHYPIIFITGHGDIPMSVQAMKAGAVEFLTKPFRDQDLIDAITLAIRSDRGARKDRAELSDLRASLSSLTPREREVMALVVMGMLNKQIAFELRISEKTIKAHRAQVMSKMQAGSLAELVHMADKLANELAGPGDIRPKS
jgi:FixJ family two-component response regulator